MFIAPFDLNFFIMANTNYDFVIDNSNSSGPYKGKSIDKDKFLDWIQQFEGTDFYNQYLNAFNTYDSQSFQNNVFQDLGWQWFGDNSAWNNFENARLTTFFDSLARIQDAQHQESHNSAPSQVAEARLAGINSDLSGNVPQSPAGNLDNLETPSPAPVSSANIIGEVGSSAIQVISAAMSFAQSFQSLSQGEIQLGLGSLNLFKESEDTIGTLLGDRLSESDIRAFLDDSYITKDNIGSFGVDYDENEDWQFQKNKAINNNSSKIYEVLSSIKDDYRLPASLRRKLKKAFSYNPDSADFRKRLYRVLNDYYTNKRGAVESGGHPFTSGGFESCLKLFGNHIKNTVIKVQELQSKFETDRLSVQGENGESLGTLAGQSDATAFSAEKYSKEYQKIVDKMWDDILKDLQKDDSWWSSILQFLIPIARSWLSNISLPSVSHSTSINEKGQSSSNSSWSF